MSKQRFHRRLAPRRAAGRLGRMLTEFPTVKQEAGAGHRRWFEGGGLELIVWYGPDRRPEGFQLCYLADDHRERALTWRPGDGFNHAAVDSGDARPDKNMTPILVRDGAVPWERVETQFARQSAGLESALREYVLEAFKARVR
jgi:hypothetical protein